MICNIDLKLQYGRGAEDAVKISRKCLFEPIWVSVMLNLKVMISEVKASRISHGKKF